jgi:hypothetical protein
MVERPPTAMMSPDSAADDLARCIEELALPAGTRNPTIRPRR